MYVVGEIALESGVRADLLDYLLRVHLDHRTRRTRRTREPRVRAVSIVQAIEEPVPIPAFGIAFFGARFVPVTGTIAVLQEGVNEFTRTITSGIATTVTLFHPVFVGSIGEDHGARIRRLGIHEFERGGRDPVSE